MNVLGKYPDRRRAERRAEWHNDIDRPSKTGIDHDLWTSIHGPPLRYEVEPIKDAPDEDGCRWRVVAYPDG